MNRLTFQAALVCAALLAACADQCLQTQEARRIIEAPPNTKVVSVQWDAQGIWVAVRPMLPTDTPEDWQVNRSSATGLTRQSVIVREHRVSESLMAVGFTAED